MDLAHSQTYWRGMYHLHLLSDPGMLELGWQAWIVQQTTVIIAHGDSWWISESESSVWRYSVYDSISEALYVNGHPLQSRPRGTGSPEWHQSKIVRLSKMAHQATWSPRYDGFWDMSELGLCEAGKPIRLHNHHRFRLQSMRILLLN